MQLGNSMKGKYFKDPSKVLEGQQSGLRMGMPIGHPDATSQPLKTRLGMVN